MSNVQLWNTLPSVAQEIVTTMLHSQAKNRLAAGRTHMRTARSKKSATSREKESDRAQRKMLEATAMMSAYQHLTGKNIEESRIILP